MKRKKNNNSVSLYPRVCSCLLAFFLLMCDWHSIRASLLAWCLLLLLLLKGGLLGRVFGGESIALVCKRCALQQEIPNLRSHQMRHLKQLLHTRQQKENQGKMKEKARTKARKKCCLFVSFFLWVCLDVCGVFFFSIGATRMHPHPPFLLQRKSRGSHRRRWSSESLRQHEHIRQQHSTRKGRKQEWRAFFFLFLLHIRV